jgi:hypothetical protein
MTMTNQHTDSVLIQQMEILKGDNTMTKTPDYNDEAVAAGPRVWWMNVYQDGSADLIHRTKEEAVLFSRGLYPTPFRTIRVVEQPESDT